MPGPRSTRTLPALAALALALALPSAASAAGSWALVNTGGLTTQFNSSSNPDVLHSRTVGNGGQILASDNGGASGGLQSSGTTQNLNDVMCADVSNCWAVGAAGVITRTSNGST